MGVSDSPPAAPVPPTPRLQGVPLESGSPRRSLPCGFKGVALTRKRRIALHVLRRQCVRPRSLCRVFANYISVTVDK